MNYVDVAHQYARDVLDGKILACKEVKAACQRQLDDLEREKNDPAWPYYFSIEKALHICTFIELLPHTKGEWKSPRIILEPWQCFFLCCVFGWLKKENNKRRFRTFYLEVPRKNAKTTIVAAIGLYLFAADGEIGAEVYCAATKKDQAKILFGIAWEMARMEAGFRQRFGVQLYKKTLSIAETGSVMEALSAEDETQDGLNIHGAMIDELHAHKTRGMHDVLVTGTGSRMQPLIGKITTAGFNRAGICYEQRGYVVKILNAVIIRHGGMGYEIKGQCVEDETYWGIIYTIDKDDEWWDPLVWAKANPNLGVSVFQSDIESECRQALSTASAQNNFQTKRLNVWVNADVAWMDMFAWDKCGDDDLSEEDFKGDECIGALDLASKIDIAAKIKMFRRNIDGKDHYYLFLKSYLPELAIETSSNDSYRGWVEDGWITKTPGNIIDYAYIENDLIEDASKYEFLEIPYDPYQATQLVTRMTEEGLPMVELRPNVLNFSEPMKELEALVIAGRLHHNNNPVLTWMVSNVICHHDAKDNIYPRKESADKKIDGVVAAIMALARFMAMEDYTSVYDKRGVIVV